MNYTKIVTYTKIQNINISVQSVQSCKKTGLILRYIVLLCIFSDYYHNPVLNEQIGEEDYVTDKFTYADLKIATT